MTPPTWTRTVPIAGACILALVILSGCLEAPDARATEESAGEGLENRLDGQPGEALEDGRPEEPPGEVGRAGAARERQQEEQEQEEPELGFFITSVGPGDGANLGGLEGADAHCQALAEAVGAGHRSWRAYLSTQATDDQPAVHARDRIGEGPWHNVEGLQIAADVDDLHYNNAAVNYEHALDEKGEPVASGAMGDPVTHHDILTGSRLDGTAFPPGEDRTCRNWTSAGEGSAMVGHHDRFRFQTFGSPWNSAHPSRGCSQEALEGTGGAGLFYCFAAR